MLPEGQQLSHYRLVRLLKSGGMGEVYLAVDSLLHRHVAIKVIDTDAFRYAETDAAKDAARLFLREAQAIAQLDQTNILPLYDSGEQSVNGIALMYMAPEQWEGKPVPATDQYALAVMAYELLTGRPPFVGNGYQHMWHQHCYVQPSPPSMINPTLPQELDAVFLRALEKDPQRRYSSVSDFAHTFQRVVLNSGNVHQTLTISALEAQTGTNRLLPLPGGRQVMVPILPGVNHGQVIRLEGFGRPTTYNNPVGALIVTIFIAPVVASEAVSPTTPTFQHTLPVSSSLARNEAKPTLPPVPLKKRKAKNKTMIVISMAFVLVLLSGIIGFYQTTISGKPPVTKAATHDPIPSYPTYLIRPKIGKLALYDPLKDESKGYVWNPNPSTFPYCFFQGETLHVWVYGDDSNPIHFRPC